MIVFHVLVTVTYSNSYVKAIIVSTFWSATTQIRLAVSHRARASYSYQ